MFILSKFSDIVRLAPSTFSIATETALTSTINAKFSNKVVQDVGLCICLFDILHSSDGVVKAGDGCAYVTVEFRLIVFRPIMGEVLTGKVSNCSPDGIKVTLGFFDDILIPKHLLFDDTIFDPSDQSWVWKSDDTELYFDLDATIRFKVEEEMFIDCTPGKKGLVAEGISPYSLIGSAQVSGLGDVAWWEG